MSFYAAHVEEVEGVVNAMMLGTCQRKSAYSTKHIAVTAAQRIYSSATHDGSVLTVYRCPANKNHWHLGRKSDWCRTQKESN